MRSTLLLFPLGFLPWFTTFAEEAVTAPPSQEPPSDQVLYFEKNIRPVLIEHCYKCHSAQSEKIKGGLTLDTKQGTQLGGESGIPGVTPGQPEKSSIYQAMTWSHDDMQMPPKTKLPDEVIAHFKKWIEMGATDPRKQAMPQVAGAKRQINMTEGRKHWAFQKPKEAPLPTVSDPQWPRQPMDHFILSELEKNQLVPNTDTDRYTLIRRISFDLTGLPPTPDEIQTFLADQSPKAVERVIDLYLDSPRFGERWARHWLDTARYAESSGKDINVLYPHAWRYRDYVIESFNKDKPYDQFLKEQIAGDLMRFESKQEQAEKIIATGFLAIGAKGHNNRDKRQFKMDLVDEQIDAVSQAMLGLTLACARCHDHKFDPVTQRDYYALAGIFLSSDTLYGTYGQLQNLNPSTLIELDRSVDLPSGVAALSPSEYAQLKNSHEDAIKAADNLRSQVLSQNPRENRNANVTNFLRVRTANDRAESIRADLDLFDKDGRPKNLTMGVLDREAAINSPLLVRGEISQPGEVVPRGLVEVLCAENEPLNIAEGSGRLDLAWFIASKDNPLTARVMVNRVWMKLMGSPLVATPDNFGIMGQKPTHPDLLDHLALRFMNEGWSIKSLIRYLLLSRSYQLSSQHHAANQKADPDNKLHWRMSPRRLEAEAIRDAMLAVSGSLNFYPLDGSPVMRAGEGRQGLFQLAREITSQPYPYRSIYLPIVRDQIPEFLTVFDFPDASLVTSERDSTNVPSQSLFLMNHPQILSLADAFAEKIANHPGTPQERLNHAYLLALGRLPSPAESSAIQAFWTRFPQKFTDGKNTQQAREAAKKAALSAFCQSLLASADFRYLN